MYVSDHTRAIVHAIAERVRFVHQDACAFRPPRAQIYEPSDKTLRAMAHGSGELAAAAVHEQRVMQQRIQGQAAAAAAAAVAAASAAAGAATPAPTVMDFAGALSPARAALNSIATPGAQQHVLPINALSSPTTMDAAHGRAAASRRDIVDYAMRRVASVPPSTRVTAEANTYSRRSAAVEEFRESAFRSGLAKYLPPAKSSVVQEVLLRNSRSNSHSRHYASSAGAFAARAAARAESAAVAERTERILQEHRPSSTSAPREEQGERLPQQHTHTQRRGYFASPAVDSRDPALRMGAGFPHTFAEQELRGRVGPGTERFLLAQGGVDPDAVRRAVEYTAQTNAGSRRPNPETAASPVVAMMADAQQRRVYNALTSTGKQHNNNDDDDELEELPYDSLGDTRGPAAAAAATQRYEEIGSADDEEDASYPAHAMRHDEILAEARRLGLRVPGMQQMAQPRDSEFVTSAASKDTVLVGDRAAFYGRGSGSGSAAGGGSGSGSLSPHGRSGTTVSQPSAHLDTQSAGLSQAKLLHARIQKRAEKILGSGRAASGGSGVAVTVSRGASQGRATAPIGARTEAPTRAHSWLAVNGSAADNGGTSLRAASAVGRRW